MLVTSMVRRQHSRWLVVIVGLLVTACGTPSSPSPPEATGPAVSAATSAAARSGPTPTPLPPERLGIDWGKAASVERPQEAFEQPSPGASFAFSLGSNRSGHPLHFPGQAIMADVARRPGGDLVAVGYVYPGWHPQAWTSSDGRTWSLAAMGTTEFTFPVAMAVGADGSLVAVGRSGTKPIAWSSPDGRDWTPHAVPTIGTDGIAERMTSVISTPTGFLSGGSVGPELGDRHARFWTSADGVTWIPVPDDADAFADAEVRAILATGGGFVALGTVGNVQDVTGSVAWTSPDGRSWARVEDPALGKGRAVALVEAPLGGLVAVGSDVGEDEAFAWTSPDGRDWTLAPSEPSRQYPGKVRMTDVTVVGDELIGVGNYVGLQRGTAISWVSRDGLRWEEARSAPVQEQGEFYAVVPAGPGLVAVGSFGAPDDYIPTVWLSPAR